MKKILFLGVVLGAMLFSCQPDDGTDGLDGLDGMDGLDGISIGMISEDLGEGCSRLTFFKDTDNNSLLDPDEDVITIIDLCDGEDGLTYVFDFTDADEVQCPLGGVIIDVYLDVDKDGVVSDGDILAKTTIHCFNQTPNSGTTYMFGTTSRGGANDYGTIYRVDQNGLNFQKVFDFSNETGGRPSGGMTLAGNGKLYGFTDIIVENLTTTVALGAFYEFDPQTNSLTVLKQFDTDSEFGWVFKHSPLLTSDGLLYAFSSISGTDGGGNGKIWSYDPSNGTFSTPVELDASLYGVNESKLMQASDGDIYFTTQNSFLFGGISSIMRFNPGTSTFTQVHQSWGVDAATYDPGYLWHYDGATNNPLYQASNGVIYGASRMGGNSLDGNFFKIDGAGYETLRVFYRALANEGFRPQGGFLEINEKLYSATSDQGTAQVGSGSFYTYDINTGALSFPHILDWEGVSPLGTFVQSPNGRLYITCSGGVQNGGSIVEWNIFNNTITQRYSFNNSANGIIPLRDELTVVTF